MKALVVYETSYGNTRLVAEAIADGLSGVADVLMEDVTTAVPAVPDDVDLLVVGGPTQAFSMSRPASREEASRRVGGRISVGRRIREWLESLTSGNHPQVFAGFDTRMNKPLLNGAASKSATRAAKHLGFTTVRPNSFVVESYDGPPRSGEIERAQTWGAELARQAATHRAG